DLYTLSLHDALPISSVDDIVQNVFLKIYLHIDELKDQSKFQNWVFQITRHAIIDHYRRVRPTDSLPDELLFDSAADDHYLTQELDRKSTRLNSSHVK